MRTGSLGPAMMIVIEVFGYCVYRADVYDMVDAIVYHSLCAAAAFVVYNTALE